MEGQKAIKKSKKNLPRFYLKNMLNLKDIQENIIKERLEIDEFVGTKIRKYINFFLHRRK